MTDCLQNGQGRLTGGQWDIWQSMECLGKVFKLLISSVGLGRSGHVRYPPSGTARTRRSNEGESLVVGDAKEGFLAGDPSP